MTVLVRELDRAAHRRGVAIGDVVAARVTWPCGACLPGEPTGSVA